MIDQLFSLKGRTALVTGGSRGIGKMIAAGFLAAGAKVYITSRKAVQCDATARELASAGPCISLPRDISTLDGCRALTADYLGLESKLDVLVNNAGAAWGAPFDEFPEHGWDKVMNLNVKSPFFLTQCLHAALAKAASAERPAKVINMASIAGLALTHTVGKAAIAGFERLFGEGGKIDPAASAERDAADQSSLDTVTGRIAELKARLGPSDRRKLDEYLQSIRDVERRIQVAMRKRPADLPNLARPAGVPDSWPEHVKIMFDLQALALQADLTRVWTFMLAREASSMTFPHLGITMGHHEISHHNFEADKLAALSKINVNQSELFAYFLTRLEALNEGNATLLDHSLILWGSDLSVPTVHSQHNLPIVVAGGAAGRIPGGRHIVYPGDTTPLTNLYLTMLDKVGVPTETLGDSTGKLNRLEV